MPSRRTTFGSSAAKRAGANAAARSVEPASPARFGRDRTAKRVRVLQQDGRITNLHLAQQARAI